MLGAEFSGLIIETYAPDIILLLIGTNDIWHVLETVPTALGYYSSMLDSIATHGREHKTIVGSLPPINAGVSSQRSAAISMYLIRASLLSSRQRGLILSLLISTPD